MNKICGEDHSSIEYFLYKHKINWKRMFYSEIHFLDLGFDVNHVNQIFILLEIFDWDYENTIFTSKCNNFTYLSVLPW